MKFIEASNGYHINVKFIMGFQILNNGPCVKFTMSDGSIVNKCFVTISDMNIALSEISNADD